MIAAGIAVGLGMTGNILGEIFKNMLHIYPARTPAGFQLLIILPSLLLCLRRVLCPCCVIGLLGRFKCLVLNYVLAALCVKTAVRCYGITVFVCRFVKAAKLAVLFIIIIVHKNAPPLV